MKNLKEKYIKEKWHWDWRTQTGRRDYKRETESEEERERYMRKRDDKVRESETGGWEGRKEVLVIGDGETVASLERNTTVANQIKRYERWVRKCVWVCERVCECAQVRVRVCVSVCECVCVSGCASVWAFLCECCKEAENLWAGRWKERQFIFLFLGKILKKIFLILRLLSIFSILRKSSGNMC